MGQQDNDGKQCDSQPLPDGGGGASGEGAGSAFEAMLKKRLQHITPAPEPVAPAAVPPPSGSSKRADRSGS